MTVLLGIWLAWPLAVLAVRLGTRPRPHGDAVTTYATVAMFGMLVWVGYIFVTLLLVWLLGADTSGSDIDWSLGHIAAAGLAMLVSTPLVWRIGGARF